MHKTLETDDWDQYIDLENDEYLYKYLKKEMFAPSNISFSLADVEIHNPDYMPSYIVKRSVKEDMEEDENLKQFFVYMVSMLFIYVVILILS
jgi:hypothetical protein